MSLLKSMFSAESIPVWTALGAVASGVATLVASRSANAAAKSAHISELGWRAQSEPKVIVYTKLDAERQTILLIRIENIGRDIARDVTFVASRPIPRRAMGLTPGSAQPIEAMPAGPLVSGIPALGPGDYREITWGQFWGLKAALADGPIVLDYTYRFDGRTLTGKTILEVESYRETNGVERAVETTARDLKRVADSLELIAGHSATAFSEPAHHEPNASSS